MFLVPPSTQLAHKGSRRAEKWMKWYSRVDWLASLKSPNIAEPCHIPFLAVLKNVQSLTLVQIQAAPASRQLISLDASRRLTPRGNGNNPAPQPLTSRSSPNGHWSVLLISLYATYPVSITPLCGFVSSLHLSLSDWIAVSFDLAQSHLSLPRASRRSWWEPAIVEWAIAPRFLEGPASESC